MTYRLDPGMRRITSPILIIFPDGTEKRYRDGEELIGCVFDRMYVPESIRAVNDVIEITLKEPGQPDETFF